MVRTSIFAFACLVVASCVVTSISTARAQPTASPAFTPPPPGPISTAVASPVAAPAASPTPAAVPAPTPTPYKLITISGSGDGGFTSIGGADAARYTYGAPSRIFDVSTGPFFDANGGRQLAGPNNFNNALDLQNANVSLTLNGSVISAKFEGSFGTDADVIASNGQSHSGSNLTQAYVQGVKGPFTVIVGKFETLAGAELIEAPLNSNYSRAYQFGYAVPFTHTGARVTYAYNSKVSVVAGVNNGWDDWKFDGKKKTLEGALLLNISPAIVWNNQTYNGNDFAVSGNSSIGALPVYTNRMLYDSVLTVHLTSALTLIANYDNGTQLADDGTAFSQTAHWNGIAGYLNYQFSPLYGLSLRKESFHDLIGFRTGVPQRLQSNTATLNYTPNANLLFRAEVRLDTTDANDFAYRGYAAGLGYPFDGRNHQASIGLESVFKFP